jgi:hypothetical protein
VLTPVRMRSRFTASSGNAAAVRPSVQPLPESFAGLVEFDEKHL